MKQKKLVKYDKFVLYEYEELELFLIDRNVVPETLLSLLKNTEILEYSPAFIQNSAIYVRSKKYVLVQKYRHREPFFHIVYGMYYKLRISKQDYEILNIFYSEYAYKATEVDVRLVTTPTIEDFFKCKMELLDKKRVITYYNTEKAMIQNIRKYMLGNVCSRYMLLNFK